MPEAIEKTEVGKLGGIEEKDNGWFELKIEVDNLKYPVRVATKRESIVQEARELRGQICTWTFKEQESEKVNPNSGKPYINRYLESIKEGGVVSSNGSSTAGGKEDVDWDAKERRDFRSRAWAQTLGTFQYTVKVDDDPLLVFERLRPFQQRLYLDVVGKEFADPGTQQVSSESGNADEPPFVDDDIPF